MRLIEGLGAGDPRLDDFRDLSSPESRPDRRGIVIAEGVNVVA
ncbi:MAG: RNA methyltransferase, partial [Jatrophihabitans sp.]